MADPTFVLVDAGMVAGFRRATPSLAQLHQALVHLHLQHPEARVAVVADPSLKWDLGPGEQPAFEGDIIARAVVCAPAGALEGTTGFMTRSAERASTDGFDVVAFTDRALSEVALGRLRNDGGRWVWDLDATTVIDEAATRQVRQANGGANNRNRRRRR
jgi:hypothetical protein